MCSTALSLHKIRRERWAACFLQVIKLENIGREQHTYLMHLIFHWSDLARLVQVTMTRALLLAKWSCLIWAAAVRKPRRGNSHIALGGCKLS